METGPRSAESELAWKQEHPKLFNPQSTSKMFCGFAEALHPEIPVIRTTFEFNAGQEKDGTQRPREQRSTNGTHTGSKSGTCSSTTQNIDQIRTSGTNGAARPDPDRESCRARATGRQFQSQSQVRYCQTAP